MKNSKQNLGIPNFFLFGEEPKESVGNYLHVESIADRSGPLNWAIRLHSHSNLAHLLHVFNGHGVMTAEERQIAFAGPCILLVPARMVHGFIFAPEIIGAVVTVSSAYLTDVLSRYRNLARLFDDARAVPVGLEANISSCIERLARELSWTAAGHDIAVEASLLTILVECVRALEYSQNQDEQRPGAQSTLVARFRELIEQNYRTTQTLDFYISSLGTTPSSLRNACVRVTGSPPLTLIQNRVMLEAKRALLYSNMSVKETAHYLGFSDTAYFTRVFTKRTGQSPRIFRGNSSVEKIS